MPESGDTATAPPGRRGAWPSRTVDGVATPPTPAPALPADETITVPTSAVITAAMHRRVRWVLAAPATEHVSWRLLKCPPESNAHGNRAVRTHRDRGLRPFVPRADVPGQCRPDRSDQAVPRGPALTGATTGIPQPGAGYAGDQVGNSGAIGKSPHPGGRWHRRGSSTAADNPAGST